MLKQRLILSRPLNKASCPATKKATGHAMTEFVVVALFLTPILLCLPYIAKFYETKHRATQMARYMAWEDTVYGSKLSGGNQKSSEQMQSDLIDRFLTTSNQRLASNKPLQTSEELTWDPFIASFIHANKQTHGIIQLDQFKVASRTIENDSILQDALAASVSPLSLTGFSIDTNGLRQYTTSVPMAYPDWLNVWLGTDTEQMLFEQQIVMYSDSWNTSSNSHQKQMVSSLMPSRVLPARLVTKVLSITSNVMPWTSKWSTLEFGHINVSSAPDAYYRQATP